MKVYKSFLKIFSTVLAVVLSLTLAQSVYALTISDDPTGGDCTSVGKWNAKTKTCKLLMDVSGSGIVIDSDDTTLVCYWHSITGSGYGSGYSIAVYGRRGVTIKDCIVENFELGILISSSDDTTLKNNIVRSNGGGIAIISSDNTTLKNNTASWSYIAYGIAVNSSTNSNLSGNTVESNRRDGIHLGSSDNNHLNGNTVNYNAEVGIGLGSSKNNYLNGNIVNYSGVFGILLSSSDNNYLNNNTVNSNHYFGIFLSYSSNNYLNNNIADNNGTYGYSIEPLGADGDYANNAFSGNECSNNGSAGSYPTGLCSPQP